MWLSAVSTALAVSSDGILEICVSDVAVEVLSRSEDDAGIRALLMTDVEIVSGIAVGCIAQDSNLRVRGILWRESKNFQHGILEDSVTSSGVALV
jgi:hypothetical protein